MGETAYGPQSSLEQALRNSASWACIDVLADAVARTPFVARRNMSSTSRVMDPQPRFVANPSGIVLPDVARYQLAWSLLTDGNAFAQITGLDIYGWPTSCEMLDPATVGGRKVEDGVPVVAIGPQRERHRLYPFGDVWHVPGKMVPAGTPFALSPVAYANQAIGTSLSAEMFSKQFFTDGAIPSGVLKADVELTAEQADTIKARWRQSQAERSVAVVGSGLTYEPVSVNPGESSVTDLLRFEVENACRFWRVPPSMVYAASSGQNVTYANVTQADLNFLKHSMDGYLVRVEMAYTNVLPRPQVVTANRDAILRNDVKGRMDVAAIQLQNAIRSVNEVRVEEGLEPYPDPMFDVPGIPGKNAAPSQPPQPSGV